MHDYTQTVIEKELPMYRHKLFQLNEEIFKSARSLEVALSKLETDKKCTMEYLRHEYVKCCELVQQRHTKHKTLLNNFEESISHTSSLVLSVTEKLNRQLRRLDPLEYHRHLKADLDNMTDMQGEITKSKNDINCLPLIDIDLIPSYKVMSVEVSKQRLLQNGGLFVCPVLGYCGMTWRLKIVNASQMTGRNNSLYISAFVQLVTTLASMDETYSPNTTASPTLNKFQFFVSLRDLVKRESIAKYSPGESWGFSRFISIDDIEKCQGDVILVSFGVRHLNHRDQSHSQNQYIMKLESDREKAAGQLSNFRQRLQRTLVVSPEVDEPRELTSFHDVLTDDMLYDNVSKYELREHDDILSQQDSLRMSDLDVECVTPSKDQLIPCWLVDAPINVSQLNQSLNTSELDII